MLFQKTNSKPVSRGRRPRRGHGVIAAALMTIPMVATGQPASATSAEPPRAILEDCRENATILPGVEALVRNRVPAQFELVRDPIGRPLLAVVASRCERYTVNGITRPTNFTYFVALIKSPDGGGCGSQWPILGGLKPDLLPLCNFYNFFAAYDNITVAEAYRAALPHLPIYYAPDLTFELGAFSPIRLGRPFRYRAGESSPSPFELEGTVRDGLVPVPMTLSFWASGPEGIHGGRFEVDDFILGQMDVRLRAAPGSDMARMLGTTTPTALLGFANRYHHAEGTLIPPMP